MDVLWYLIPVTVAWLGYTGHHAWQACRARGSSAEMEHLARVMTASVALAGVNVVVVVLIHAWRAIS